MRELEGDIAHAWFPPRGFDRDHGDWLQIDPRDIQNPRHPCSQKQQILVEYLDGPFRHLENRWRFLPSGSGCEVDFYITYEFRSRMLALLMGAVFDKAFRKFATAFEARARQLYRPPLGAVCPATSTV